MVEILANNYPVARGQVVVTGTRIAVEITEILKKPHVARVPGTTIGDASLRRSPPPRLEIGRAPPHLGACGGKSALLNAPPLGHGAFGPVRTPAVVAELVDALA